MTAADSNRKPRVIVPELSCLPALHDYYQASDGKIWLASLVCIQHGDDAQNATLLAKLDWGEEHRSRQFQRWECEPDQVGAVERAFEYVVAELGYHANERANALDLLAAARNRAIEHAQRSDCGPFCDCAACENDRAAARSRQ